MATVGKILEAKGSEVFSIGPEESVYHALEVMDEKGVGALAVMDRGRLIGMMSERSYARKVILKGRSSKNTKVRDIMSSPVITASLDWDIDECMRVMTQRHIRHLPVVEDGQLRGIISIGDVVKAIISHQQSTIESLSDYMQIRLEST